MDTIDLSQTSGKYLINNSGLKTESKQGQVQNNNFQTQDQSKLTQEDGNKKLFTALAGLSAIAAAGVGIALAIKKGRNPIKSLTDISFNKGIAKLNNGKNYTGIVQDTLKNGDKITLEYADGVIKKSARKGSKSIEKVYETLEDGSRIVTKTQGDKVVKTNITDIQNSVKKAQKDLNKLFDKKDELDISDFKKQANAIVYKSEKQQSEINDVLSHKQAIIDEKKAQEEAQRAAQKAREEAAQKAAQEAAQKAREEALSNFKIKKDDEVKDFKNALSGASEQELKKYSDMLATEHARLTEISVKNKNAACGSCNGICDPNYLFDEDKISFDAFLEKRKLILFKQSELDDNFLCKYLYKEGDKPVKTAWNSSYLNRDELKAFDKYYDECSDNYYSRKSKGKYKNKLTDLMDSGFKKAPALQDDAMVYRAVTPRGKETNAFFDSIRTGETIQDFAYMSTSTRIATRQFKQFALRAKENNGTVLMRIHLPKGTKGVLGGSYEYILPRNSKLKIVSTETINGVKVANCEYILP